MQQFNSGRAKPENNYGQVQYNRSSIANSNSSIGHYPSRPSDSLERKAKTPEKTEQEEYPRVDRNVRHQSIEISRPAHNPES